MSSSEFEGFKYAYEIDLDQDNTASKLIRLVGKNKDVLEFGCGPGHMSKVLVEEMGCRVTGIEIDKLAAKVARRYCRKVYCLDLNEANLAKIFRRRRFDVLLFADILEHLKKPERILKQAPGLLKKDGYIVASVPNIGYCGVVAELLSGRFQYRGTGILDETHLRFFTRESLVLMFKKLEFEIEIFDTYELPLKYSEFEGVLERLPEEIRDFIIKTPDSMAYQYIIKVKVIFKDGFIGKIFKRIRKGIRII